MIVYKSGETPLGHKINLSCIAEEMKDTPEKASIHVETRNSKDEILLGEYYYNRYDNTSYIDWDGDAPEDWEDLEEIADKLFHELEIETGATELTSEIAITLVKEAQKELEEDINRKGRRFLQLSVTFDKLIKQLEKFR